MIFYILESSAIWLILYSFYFLVLRKETFFQFNRFYLLFGILAGLLIPFIEIDIAFGREAAIIETILEPIQFSGNQYFQEIGSKDISGSALINFKQILLVIYLTGFGLFAFRLLKGLQGIIKLYRGGKKLNYRSYVEVSIKNDLVPFSFFNLMFIPDSRYQRSELTIIKRHELRHIRDLHSLDIIILEIVKIIFWFNPIILLFKRSVVELHEFIADKSSLEISKKKDYGNLLLSLKKESFSYALANSIGNSIIKNRLIMMYQINSNKRKTYKYFLILPLFLFVLFVFSCKQDTANTEIKSESLSDVEQKITDREKKDQVFKVVEEMPLFPGCDEGVLEKEDLQKCANKKLMEFVFGALKYPEKARKNKIEGRVIAQFVINEDGKVQDIEIKEDIGEGCGDEVKRVLESMNQMEALWIPGKQRGEKVKVQYTIPVVFKLS